jgi:polyhydroxybutyrate depolymerase
MKIRLLISFILVSNLSLAYSAEPETMRWKIENVERVALVYAPSAAGPAKVPAIFAFHGHGGNMHFAARGMHFQDAWPEALVVYMQGLPTPSLLKEDRQGQRPGWQHRPGELNDRDLEFFDQALAELRKKYSIDERRIYATGFSNGGFFTYLLWAARPDVFAGFAPGACMVLPALHLTQPRPCLHFGEKSDRLVPFAKQTQTMDEVRKLNGCAARGEPCGTYCTLYPSASGAPLETFIVPGGHLYPPPVTERIVQFFKEHPKP